MKTKFVILLTFCFVLLVLPSALAQFTGGSYDGHAMGESEGDIPLSVTLSSFSAVHEDGAITLLWHTETELDNVGFAIYRRNATDGSYAKVAFVLSAEDSETSNDYRFTDKEVETGQTYFYYLEDIDVAGKKNSSEIVKVVIPPAELIPTAFGLFQNYPNPFNPETWIPYALAKDAPVSIRIYDVKGQLIRQLDIGEQKAGGYLVKEKAAYWDGKNQSGQSVSSGLYFYCLKAGDFLSTRRMVILK